MLDVIIMIFGIVAVPLLGLIIMTRSGTTIDVVTGELVPDMPTSNVETVSRQ